MKEKTLSVPGVSCGHCKNAIEGAVRELPGIDRVNVDVDKKNVLIQWDENKVGLREIAAAIRDQGYEPQES